MSRASPLDDAGHPPRSLSPTRRVTSATQIFDVLRTEIVALRLPPGTPLVDRFLVERFGVSRTPVREALIRLAEMGLVDVRPQSGTFVSRVPVNAIPEAVLVRKALEGITVELAAVAAVAAPSRMGAIDAAIGRQRSCAALGDSDGFHEADEGFHAAIADLSGHPGIWTLLAQTKIQIDRARRLTLPVLGRMEQVIGEHEVIRARIADGSAAGAKAAMMQHLDAVIPDVDELKGRYPHYFA